MPDLPDRTPLPAYHLPPAAAAVTVTRTEAAMRTMTRAAERLRRLESDEQSAFAEYAAAQEALAAEGVVCDVELSPGMAASFSVWKQRQLKDEAREMVAEEWQPQSVGV